MEIFKIASYPEAESTFKVGQEKLGQLFHASTNLNERNSNEFVTITFPKAGVDHLIQLATMRSQAITLRQDYCFIAIKNLLKKAAYLQLSLELAENQITDEEFQLEIDTNPDKYIIKINMLEDPSHLHTISGILENVGSGFNTGQVSEMFSVNISSVNQGMALIGVKLD